MTGKVADRVGSHRRTLDARDIIPHVADPEIVENRGASDQHHQKPETPDQATIEADPVRERQHRHRCLPHVPKARMASILSLPNCFWNWLSRPASDATKAARSMSLTTFMPRRLSSSRPLFSTRSR